jgi:hypothetical protein
LLLKNTVFSAETTTAPVPIPDPQEPIALWETQHQLAAQTDAPSQAVQLPRPRKQSPLARQQTPQKAN